MEVSTDWPTCSRHPSTGTTGGSATTSRRGSREAGLHSVETDVIVASVDLNDASDDVLDFTVQGRLTDDLAPLVRAYLRAVALPGDALVVGHPADVYRVAWADSPPRGVSPAHENSEVD